LELITRTCEPSQSHPLKVMMDLEMRKSHLDLLALIARFRKLRSTHECADLIAGLFVDVACDLSEWGARASLLEFASAALSGLRQVIPNAAVVNCSRGSQ
jgi:hypothetical protein